MLGLQGEEERRKILQLLADNLAKNPDGFITDKAIAKNCGTNEATVKEICTGLKEGGLIQSKTKEGQDSFRISTNGLIVLEGYSRASGEGNQVSKINQAIKRGFGKLRISSEEIQADVIEIGRKYHLRDGLFYIVLIDLAGSTNASLKMEGVVFDEWIKRFLSITKEALNTKRRNLAVFVKSIGDGSLFLFRNFNDILEWKNRVDEFCVSHNTRCHNEGKLVFHHYHHKIIIHLSEVYFDEENSDINSFGVNLVFKIEKRFSKSEVGITDAVRHLIVQDINAGKFRIHDAESYSVENADYQIPLWKLVTIQ